MKFCGLDVVGGKDPELAMCGDDSRIAGGSGASAMPVDRLVFKEHALVFHTVQSDEVSVSIMNATGRIIYNGHHRVQQHNAAITVPTKGLQPGCYISSATCREKDDRIKRYTIHFAVTK